jgi:hypothetical protein
MTYIYCSRFSKANAENEEKWKMVKCVKFGKYVKCWNCVKCAKTKMKRKAKSKKQKRKEKKKKNPHTQFKIDWYRYVVSGFHTYQTLLHQHDIIATQERTDPNPFSPG